MHTVAASTDARGGFAGRSYTRVRVSHEVKESHEPKALATGRALMAVDAVNRGSPGAASPLPVGYVSGYRVYHYRQFILELR